MNGCFLIRLEARNPTRNVLRSYEVAIGRDLLGDWLVEVSYGRIGSGGRILRHAFTDEIAAIRFAQSCLRKRESAPRRIGVPYVLTRAESGFEWLEETYQP